MTPPRRPRASTRRGAPTVLLGALVVLSSCSSSSVVDRSGPMLVDTLSGSQQVAAVVVRPSSILVTYQEAAGTRTVQLAPSESSSTSTAHLPSAPATAFDGTAISDVAKKLAASCTSGDQVTEAFAVSATATSITTTCGTVKHSQVNSRPLAATGAGWSAADLTVLWADLEQVVPAKAVDQILLDGSSVTFTYDSGSPFPGCSRVQWTRGFDGSSSQACLPAASKAVPKVRTSALTADRLASALSQLSSEQASAASRTAHVTSSGDTVLVSVTQGSSQKSTEITP